MLLHYVPKFEHGTWEKEAQSEVNIQCKPSSIVRTKICTMHIVQKIQKHDNMPSPSQICKPTQDAAVSAPKSCILCFD